MNKMLALMVLLAAGLAIFSQAGAEDYFQIQVVDEQTGRGVPLVELTTVNDIRHWTDSAGIVAFHEPGLMNLEVFFSVKSHGYEFPKDGFGMGGKKLKVEPGGKARLKIRRVNIAERLYRVTGAGIYRDSVLTGNPVPLREPLLNGQVLGCDSVQSVVFHNRIYWFWGDTNRPSYPLETSRQQGPHRFCPTTVGSIRMWESISITSLEKTASSKRRSPGREPDRHGLADRLSLGQGDQERLFAHYQDIQGDGMNFKASGQGLAEFDDVKKEFRKVAEFPMGGPFPHGAHPALHETDGKKFIYFCDPFPLVRVEATVEALADFSRYEAFTCLKEGTHLKEAEIDRDAQGRVRWSWKRGTDPVRPQDQEKLVRRKMLPRDEAVLTLRDADTGDLVVAQRGSVAYNPFRKRWIMIFGQIHGTSLLGEIWYAEADALTRPWCLARKIVTHDHYSFYNPRHHPMLDKEDGQIIFFEGTYTTSFSGNSDKTPRYDYNQIMYRLDLSDPRLRMPRKGDWLRPERR